MLVDIILFLILVTLTTYVFIPWKDKEGKLMKPEFRTIVIWWFYSLFVMGLIIFLINSTILTLF